MKTMLFFIALGCAFFAAGESIPRDYYVVVSDVFDETVKPGTCQLSGKTVDVYENPIAGGTVSNFDRSRSCISAADGTYSITLSTKDTALFFYHENYGEVIIWKYHFQSQHRVVINFVSMEYSDIPVVEEKPVIYLYANEPVPVELTLEHDALTFTYPEYNNGWHVITNPQGGITDQSTGKMHPYLFWEGQTHNLAFEQENHVVQGSLIHTAESVEFLENTLAALGLNAVEATDFITYWGPRLMQKDYAFVQFLIDDQVDEIIAALQVNPVPQSKRRIYLLFTLLDQPQVPFEFEAQQLPGFERNGLTLLEWGGSEVNLRSVLP